MIDITTCPLILTQTETIPSNTVNSLVSDHPLSTTKCSLTGDGCLRENQQNKPKTELINKLHKDSTFLTKISLGKRLKALAY